MGAAKPIFAVVLCAILAGCSHTSSVPVRRIALLAPFEGRYREIGYEAIYAARLALSEAGLSHIELLAVDDGGSPSGAADRAQALVLDPQVLVTVTLGYAATEISTLQAFDFLPVIIAGDWQNLPVTPNTFLLGASNIPSVSGETQRIALTDAADIDAPFTGGLILALPGFLNLRPDPAGIQVLASSSLPDLAFYERYRYSDSFTPEPGLLATITYDATHIAIQAIQAGDGSRNRITNALTTLSYEGVNGLISFSGGQSGYSWADAPIHRYAYYNGRLLPVNDIME
jgi:hypothetical protein